METQKIDDEKKPDEDDKKTGCDKCKMEKCNECNVDHKHDKVDDPKRALPGKRLRRPRKNRKSLHKQDQGQCFFPMSMSILFGPLGDPAAKASPPTFPYNVTFKQVSYLLLVIVYLI